MIIRPWTEILSWVFIYQDTSGEEKTEKENRDTIKSYSCSSVWIVFTLWYPIMTWAMCFENCQFCTELQRRKYKLTCKPTAREWACIIPASLKSCFFKVIVKDKISHMKHVNFWFNANTAWCASKMVMNKSLKLGCYLRIDF